MFDCYPIEIVSNIFKPLILVYQSTQNVDFRNVQGYRAISSISKIMLYQRLKCVRFPKFFEKGGLLNLQENTSREILKITIKPCLFLKSE